MDNICVSCGKTITNKGRVCNSCLALAFDLPEKTYIDFNCPECGSALEVLSDAIVCKRSDFGYELHNLIRHCNTCHCDWKNEWWTKDGKVEESKLERKFWG